MLRRTEMTINTIVLAVVTVALVCCGILAGLVHLWPNMGLCFFLAVNNAELYAFLVLNHKIESHFKKLVELITRKSGSDRLVGKFVPNSVFICMLIFLPGLIVLSMLACNRGYWLALCILLAAFLITNAVSSSYIIWLKIKAYARHLEEAVSNKNESTAHTTGDNFCSTITDRKK